MGAIASITFLVAGITQGGPHFTAMPETLLVEQGTFGAFQGAARIDSDLRGRFFVVDRTSSTITVFSPRHERLEVLGGFGWSGTGFDHPSAVATDGISTYVADYGNHRIVRLDQSLNPVSFLATRDTSFAPARFGYPQGLALSRQGDLFVLDGENVRVLKFDRRSVFERSFGGVESGSGRLRAPVEVLVTVRDRVWVLEEDRIVEFDFAGNYVGTIGKGILSSSRGFGETENGVVVATADRLWFFDWQGMPASSIEISNIIASAPVDVMDVAVSNDVLHVLTPHTVIVFAVEQAAH